MLIGRLFGAEKRHPGFEEEVAVVLCARVQPSAM
jgi:hypothetical protein